MILNIKGSIAVTLRTDDGCLLIEQDGQQIVLTPTQADLLKNFINSAKDQLHGKYYDATRGD